MEAIDRMSMSKVWDVKQIRKYEFNNEEIEVDVHKHISIYTNYDNAPEYSFICENYNENDYKFRNLII